MLKLNLRVHQPITTIIGALLILLETANLRISSPDPEGSIVASTIIVMGFILMTYRHILIVDADRHRLIRRVGCLYLFKRKEISTDNLKQLVLREKVVRSGKSETTWYQIAASSDVICQLKNSVYARRVAETLARATSLPLDNHVHYVRSVRKPDELDQPVAERWHAHGMHGMLPVPPYETQVRVEHSAAATRISLPAEHHNLKIVAIIGGFFALLAVVMFSLMKEESRFILYILFALVFWIITLAILAFSGRTSILLTETHVMVRQGLMPFKRKLRLMDVEEFICAPDGIYLDGDEGSAWVHWAGNSADSDYLKALLAHEIARRHV